MGCWSETCGFSHLPINHGDKVMCFVIAEKHYNDGRLNSQDGPTRNYSSPDVPFEPWLFPVTAEYNDYGSIENVEDNFASKFLLDSFNKLLQEGKFDKCENWETRGGGKPSGFGNVEEIADNIERGNLYYTTGPLFYGFRLYMVHFDIFQTLTQVSEKEAAFARASWKTSNIEFGERFERRFLEMVNQEDTLLLEARTPEDEKLVEEVRGSWEQYRLDPGRMINFQYRSLGRRLPFLPTDDYFPDLMRIMKYHLILEATRRTFAPTGLAGSQYNDLKWHKKAQKAINSQIKKREQEIKEFDDEDA